MIPKITIITVCYNSDKTIARTVESVKRQDYPNLEYIIVDGASSDKTVEIINGCLQNTGIDYNLISEKDTGIYNAMNKGIKLSTGDLICMLNSDDWLEDNALRIIADHYCHEEYLVIYGLERRLENGIEKSVGFNSHNFLFRSSIPHQASYVSKKCYEDFGLYDEQYRSAGDYEFMLRLFISKKVHFIPVYSVLANFSEGGISSKAIGYIEEAKIKHKYQVITKRQYLYLLSRVAFLKFIGKLK